MKYGLSIPPFEDHADPIVLASLAKVAEDAGWDGFFVWDHILFRKTPIAVADPWIALAAIAVATERITIGPMVTPVPRRRPWVLARQCVTLDQLSNGRLILGVGIGAPVEQEFAAFGEVTDTATRAEMLDEGLDLMARLWSGKQIKEDGKHYHLKGVGFLPTPVQQPRIPIWVGGSWPNKGPMRRAARWDGVMPFKVGGKMTAKDVGTISEYITSQRVIDTPFDFVMSGATPGDDRPAGAAIVSKWESAGATWWVEDVSMWRFGVRRSNAPWPTEQIAERIAQGPPRV